MFVHIIMSVAIIKCKVGSISVPFEPIKEHSIDFSFLAKQCSCLMLGQLQESTNYANRTTRSVDENTHRKFAFRFSLVLPAFFWILRSPYVVFSGLYGCVRLLRLERTNACF